MRQSVCTACKKLQPVSQTMGVSRAGDSAGSGPAGLNEVANGNALVPAEVKIEDVGAKRALVKQEEMEDTAKRPRLE